MGGVYLLRGARHNPLQSLNLSLDLLRVLLSHHVLLVEAAIVQVVGVVKEILGFVVLGEQRPVSLGS